MVRVAAGVVKAVGDFVAVSSHEFGRVGVPEGPGAGPVCVLDDEVPVDDEHLVEQGVEDRFEVILFEWHLPALPEEKHTTKSDAQAIVVCMEIKSPV